MPDMPKKTAERKGESVLNKTHGKNGLPELAAVPARQSIVLPDGREVAKARRLTTVDGISCQFCKEGVFRLGVAATDETCHDCGGLLFAWCQECGNCLCLGCRRKAALDYRHEHGIKSLAERAGRPS